MEKALRYELIQALPELDKSIYPTNAPEGVTRPYLVYARVTTRRLKTLEGYTGKQAMSYMFSIMSVRYEDMARVRKQVEDLLVGMIQREIGSTTKFYVEDIDINNVDEQYEHQLGVNRGIIDFTIYF